MRVWTRGVISRSGPAGRAREYLLPTSSPGAISKQHLQFLSQRLENWGAQATEGTWELYDLARYDIVIFLDTQPGPRS